MSMKLFADQHVTPAEGEVTVKAYHCTALDPIFAWFGVKINGYVTITNKRLLYYSSGVTGYGVTGNSRSCAEIWLPDACNITQDIGTRFSILRLILAGIISLAVGAAFNALLLLLWLLFPPSSFSNLGTVRLAIFLQLVLAVFFTVRALMTSFDKIGRLIFSAAALGVSFNLNVILPLASGAGLPRGYVWANLALGLALAAQFLVSLYFFVRRWYFHLKVAGKNASHSPINISAESFWSVLNISSSYARNMAPAVDTATMFKELGAIVADIQTLGDFGIKKWQEGARVEPDAAPLAVAPPLVSRPHVMRYATILVSAAAAFITADGGWAAYQRAVAEARAHASFLRDQLVMIKPIDGARWAPNLTAKAAEQETAGAAAFVHEDYKEAAVFWTQAASDYKIAQKAINALQNAYREEILYEDYLRAAARIGLGKDVNGARIEPAVLAELSSFMERNVAAEWTQIKDLAAKAEAFKKAEQGAEAEAQWQAVNKVFKTAKEKIEAVKLQSAKR